MMKRMIMLAVSIVVLTCLGCQTIGGISRERAIAIAKQKATAEGRKPNEYVIEWAKQIRGQMQPADIEQALHYTAESVREREIPIRAAS